MISDSMTTPVRPTPALQCTSTGGLEFLGSAVLFVWRRTDWISSKYAIELNNIRMTNLGNKNSISCAITLHNHWKSSNLTNDIPQKYYTLYTSQVITQPE